VLETFRVTGTDFSVAPGAFTYTVPE
jgi:hypothetical protein